MKLIKTATNVVTSASKVALGVAFCAAIAPAVVITSLYNLGDMIADAAKKGAKEEVAKRKAKRKV